MEFKTFISKIHCKIAHSKNVFQNCYFSSITIEGISSIIIEGIFFFTKNINRKKHKFKFKTNQKFFNDSTRMLKLPWKYFSYQIGKFFHFLLIAQLISNLSPPEKFFSGQLII